MPRTARTRLPRIAALVGGALLMGAAACGTGHHTGASGTPSAAASRPATPVPTASSAGPAPSGQPSSAAPSSTPASGSSQGGGSASAAHAQLAAAQLPDNGREKWQPITPPRQRGVAASVRLDECATVQGAASWQQQGFASVHRTPAVQDTFTFGDPGAAQGAYQAVVAAMGSCQATTDALQKKSGLTPDAQVTRTATIQGGTAWARKWTGVEGISAAGPQTNHIYAVVQGTVLVVVHVHEWASAGSPSYDTGGDAGVLSTVARQINGG